MARITQDLQGKWHIDYGLGFTSIEGPMRASSAYNVLAPLYDITWQSPDISTPFAAIVLPKLEQELQGASRINIVDLGCGTGSLLTALERSHPDWQFAGIDSCSEMLEVARSKSPKVAWTVGDIANLPSAHKYDVAGCFHDTLNHIREHEGIIKAFNSVFEILKPDGLFIFDTTNEYGFENWWTDKNHQFNGPDWRLIVSQAWHKPIGMAAITMQRGNTVQSTTLLERWYPETVIQNYLERSGFKVRKAETWSPWIGEPGKTWWVAGKN